MGPQLDSCGRHASAERAGGGAWLQWGRNLIVAEGRLGVLGQGQRRLASMGPQLDSCGRRPCWATGRTGGLLQWGRNLIVAEGDIHEAIDAIGAELQWGRNLIVAEGKIAAANLGRKASASMGPQLDSCGRLLTARPASPSRGTVALQWGRNLIVAEGRSRHAGGRKKMTYQLQWGRNLIVAEGRRRASCTRTRRQVASMGPQLDSCGRRAPQELIKDGRLPLQWGRNLIVAEGSTRQPHQATPLEVLQWGRNLIVAEG